MLGFKDYRNKFIENEIGEDNAETTNVAANEKTTSIQNQVNQIVNAWVSDLKRTLLNPTTGPSQKRGLWDRFKGSMANLWHGRYNQNNPYFWQNKLGDDLGSTAESFDPSVLSLSDYKELRDICESLEQEINEDVPAGAENLRIVRLIDAKAQELKQKLMSIMGQTANVESPANPAASTNTEEADSPIPKEFEMVVTALQNKFKNKEISIDEDNLKELVNQLRSKKESIRTKAAEQAQSLLNQENTPDTSGVGGTPATPPDMNTGVQPTGEPEDKHHALNISTPPTTGKKWNELDPSEKMAWNIYGGGTAPGRTRNCIGVELPWILRIGDPRHQLFDDQEAGKFIKPDGSCGGKRSPLKKVFNNQGRIESPDDPITTRGELEARVSKAKSVVEAAKEFAKRRRTTTPSDEELTATKAQNDPSQPNEPVQNAPSISSDPVQSPAPEPDLKNRTAPIDPEQIKDRMMSTPDNALGHPMHRTSDIDAPPVAQPTEEPTSEKPPEKTIGLSQIRKISSAKKQLTKRIENLPDEDAKQRFADRLANAKTKEEIDAIEQDVAKDESIMGDMDFAWTLNDLTNYYKKKMHEQVDPEVIKFNERVEYYKELLEQKIK